MATSIVKKNGFYFTSAARRYIQTSAPPAPPELPPRSRIKVALQPKHLGPSSLSKLGQSRASRYAEAAAQRASSQDSGEEELEQVKKPKKEKKKKKEAPRFEPLTVSKPAHSDLPFGFRFSYTEVPKVSPIGFRERYSPFGPGRLDRPWDGQEALPVEASTGKPKVQRKRHVIDSFHPPTKKGMKPIAPPGPFLPGTGPKDAKTREEIIGEPLTKEETDMLVRESMRSKKQLNMGRDGLTHNLLISLYDYWTRERMVRVKCMGVATVDMDNMVFQIEDKTGGKVIRRAGGTLHVFRGRYYNNKKRPIIPRMLWRPHSPIYPKLVTEAPEGLTRQAANALRKRGRELLPLCRLAKNGFYGDLVENIRETFEEEDLVRIDCKAVNRPDYKKIGAKLRDLVPCVLLSFQEDQILLWKGKKRSHKAEKRLPQEDLDTKHLGKVGTVEEHDVNSKGTMAVAHDDNDDASYLHRTSDDDDSSLVVESANAFHCYETNDDGSEEETEDGSDQYETFNGDDSSDEESEDCSHLHDPDNEIDCFDDNTMNSSHLHKSNNEVYMFNEEMDDASHDYGTIDEDNGPGKVSESGGGTTSMTSAES